MSFWNSVRNSINKATDAAAKQATKTKLQADVLLIDRSINTRKEQFGIEVYDYVDENLASTTQFYASDDKLTMIIRPSFIIAQREAKAMTTGKKNKALENISKKEIERKSAFPVPAMTNVDKAKNLAISAKMKSEELKLKTDLYAIDTKIKGVKAKFGIDLYPILEKLEDDENWLPPDRDIRAIYDQTRRDIEKLMKNKQYKKDQIIALEQGESLDSVMKMDVQASVQETNPHKIQQDMINKSVAMNRQIDSNTNTGYNPNNNAPLPNNSYYNNPQQSINTGNVYNNDNSQQQQQSSYYGSTTSQPQQQQQLPPIHDPFSSNGSGGNNSVDFFGNDQLQPQQQPQSEKERQMALMFGGTQQPIQQPVQQQQQQQAQPMQQQNSSSSSFNFMNQQQPQAAPNLTMQPQSNTNINLDPFQGL